MLTNYILPKKTIDLTEQDILLEAHEKACYAYDMVNIILELKP